MLEHAYQTCPQNFPHSGYVGVGRRRIYLVKQLGFVKVSINNSKQYPFGLRILSISPLHTATLHCHCPLYTERETQQSRQIERERREMERSAALRGLQTNYLLCPSRRCPSSPPLNSLPLPFADNTLSSLNFQVPLFPFLFDFIWG